AEQGRRRTRTSGGGSTQAAGARPPVVGFLRDGAACVRRQAGSLAALTAPHRRSFWGGHLLVLLGGCLHTVPESRPPSAGRAQAAPGPADRSGTRMPGT